MAPSQPKHGRRGELPSLALDRDAKYRWQHVASLERRPAPPQTWEARVAWFVEAWEASLPTRLHTRGVEAESALGSPRMAGAMHARIDHVSDHGWGLTGHDRDGQPRGVNSDGLTRDPFLFYIERMLRSRDDYEHQGAICLMRWAYMGWDLEAAAQATFLGEHARPETWKAYLAGFKGLLNSTIQTLWARCQHEPERFPICRDCRQRRCVCGQRSEAQVNAERGSVDDVA